MLKNKNLYAFVCVVIINNQKQTHVPTKQPITESSHQRRKERIERHKKLTLQQYDNNTKALFINNINDLKNTLKNKNSKIMKKYSSVSNSSASSTCSSVSSNSDSNHINNYDHNIDNDHTIHEELRLQEEDEDEEVVVENETYTYEYVASPNTTTTTVSDDAKTTNNTNESEDEYVTECFEQTYSILDILNNCEKAKQQQQSQQRASSEVESGVTTMRSSSSMSGLSSVGSSSSSSLSNNATSSSSINIGSVSPNTTLTKSGDIYEQIAGKVTQPTRTLNTELYYPSSTRSPFNKVDDTLKSRDRDMQDTTDAFKPRAVSPPGMWFFCQFS